MPTDPLIAATMAALGLADSGGIARLGEGQLSRAVVAPPDTVVRFPRHELGVQHLRKERAVIAIVAPRTQAALPMPRAANLDAAPPDAYAAHQLVRGQLVDPALVDELPGRAFASLVEQLAALLVDLSSVPVDEVLAAGFDAAPLAVVAEDLRAEVVELLGPRLPASALRRAHSELDAMGATGAGPDVLCHCDLGGNLVWDPSRHRVGVIDWGSARLSDPALDLASITAGIPQLGAAVAAAVPHLRDRVDAAAAVRSTFALQDMLYGARQGAWDYVRAIAVDYGAGG